MALSARHKWCIDKVTQCFEGIVDDAAKVIQIFAQRPDVILQFNNFFSGEGPDAIFVHYQPNTNLLDTMNVGTH
jgi:hypothetical protein